MHEAFLSERAGSASFPFSHLAATCCTSWLEPLLAPLTLTCARLLSVASLYSISCCPQDAPGDMAQRNNPPRMAVSGAQAL